jgi:hypothetical protein
MGHGKAAWDRVEGDGHRGEVKDSWDCARQKALTGYTKRCKKGMSAGNAIPKKALRYLEWVVRKECGAGRSHTPTRE